MFFFYLSKKIAKEGLYDVYGAGNKNKYTHNEYNRDGKTLVIARHGVTPKCVRIIEGKFYLSNGGLSIHTNSNELLQDYLNYYLLYNQDKVYNCTAGSCQLGLKK